MPDLPRSERNTQRRVIALFTDPARGVHCADDVSIPTRAGSAMDRP